MSNAGNEITSALKHVQMFYQKIDQLLRAWRNLVLARGPLSPAKNTSFIALTGPDMYTARAVGVVLDTEGAANSKTNPPRVVLAVVLPESGEPTVCAIECHHRFTIKKEAWKQLFCTINGTAPTLLESRYKLLCIHPLTSVSSLADIERLLVEPVIKQFPRAASRPTP